MVILKFKKFDINAIQPSRRYILLCDYGKSDNLCVDSCHSEDIFYNWNDIDYPEKRDELIGFMPYSDALIARIREEGEVPGEVIPAGWYLIYYKNGNCETYDIFHFDKDVKSKDLYYSPYSQKFAFTPEERDAGSEPMFDLHIAKFDTSRAYASIEFYDSGYGAESPFDPSYIVTTEKEVFKQVKEAYESSYGLCSDFWKNEPTNRELRKLIKELYKSNPAPTDQEIANYVRTSIINRPITVKFDIVPGIGCQSVLMDADYYAHNGIPIHGQIGNYSF